MNRFCRVWVSLALATCAREPGPPPAPVAPPPTVARPAGPTAMVASNAAPATRAGVDLLRAGGNAVDAALATAFALAVVYPQAGNLGGGGFLVLRTAAGEAAALDFRETAPAAATRDMFLGPDGKPTSRSLDGHLAAGVPGSVAGLGEAHRRYGRRPWAEVVAPAIRLAEDGFAVDEAFAKPIADQAARLARHPASAALFLPGGAAPAVGATWRNPDLARTLRLVAERGPAGFYQGETADRIVAEMKRGGGLISHADLRDYRAKWRQPVKFPYRGHSVHSMPPPSSGGVALALIGSILEGWDLGALGRGSADAVHVTVEAMRRAFALRNATLGDPDFAALPLGAFSPAAGAALRRGIDPERATPSAAVGAPSGREGANTTHLSVVDGAGGAAALTTTINTSFGSGVTVAGAGFLLNNEMDDFTAKPGHPNLFGLVQGQANAIAPRKRMLSSMSPTIVVDSAGRVVLVTGAAGGPRIISAVFQVISNVLDHGMDVAAAARAPRFHHQHLPDEIRYEEGALTPEVARALKARGHRLAPASEIGNAQTILRRGGLVTGASEPREAGGLALGY